MKIIKVILMEKNFKGENLLAKKKDPNTVHSV